VAGCYRLTLPADTAVDVELAAGEVDAARSALAAGDLEGALGAAGRARAIAGRPLLPGHEGPWVEDRRAALRQVLIDGLETQADIHLVAGNGQAAVGPARDLVALEPFRDSAHERLVRAHAAAGDRGEALRAYDHYRRALAEELGVGPSPELEAAYLELLHAESLALPTAAAPAGPPAPAASPSSGVFVGRGRELHRLRSALTEAAAGQRRTVLVAGEAGIGKTRLGAEFAALAADGATVLAGRSDQYPGVPYLPLREALGRHLAAAPAERLRALRGPEAAELARRWPEVAWRLPTPPAPPRADQRADRYLLLEAVSGLLEAVAAGGPLLLLLDDLQGADASSLLLLRSLAHAPRPARLLTVLLYRDDELATRASLAVALGDLLRAPGAELLSLGGLATEDVVALAAATTGRPLTAAEEELARALRERTRGNPFLVGSLLATGGVERAVREVPDSVRLVVGQRLAGLGGAVEYVLGAASVLGREFDLALLTRVVDLGHESLLSTLDKAVAARLVEERPGAPGRYAFHHPLVRDVLYHGLPAGERARARRRLAAGP
jgi:hypothetical protein